MLLLTAVVGVSGAVFPLVSARRAPREPDSASQSPADPRVVAWLGSDYRQGELLDGTRSHSFLLAADVPITDAKAVVLAIRQGHLVNKLSGADRKSTRLNSSHRP